MSLHGLHCVALFQVLSIRSDVDRLNQAEFSEASLLAPGEEGADISRVGVARVFVLDFRRKKFNEALVSLCAGSGEKRREFPCRYDGERCAHFIASFRKMASASMTSGQC